MELFVDFLDQMARTSARRASAARAREPEAALRRRALDTPAPPRLVRDPSGFDVIAEIKRRSPRGPRLVAPGQAPLPVEARAAAYARAGAAAISVLTEPSRFGGALAHLERAARSVALPVMRKDFLVDPYQVVEARAAGAAGVLLVARLLDDARLGEMLDAAHAVRLFVLLEAFDAADLARIGAIHLGPDVFVGLNARDLARLTVDPGRHEVLAGSFPAGVTRVAESGVAGPTDARRLRSAGYGMVLAGEVLMRAADPESALRALLGAGRSTTCACA